MRCIDQHIYARLQRLLPRNCSGNSNVSHRAINLRSARELHCDNSYVTPSMASGAQVALTIALLTGATVAVSKRVCTLLSYNVRHLNGSTWQPLVCHDEQGACVTSPRILLYFRALAFGLLAAGWIAEVSTPCHRISFGTSMDVNSCLIRRTGRKNKVSRPCILQRMDADVAYSLLCTSAPIKVRSRAFMGMRHTATSRHQRAL
jgi:hypothetical protein